MNTSRDNLDSLLRTVARGELDSLTPEQVAQLETELNTNPAAAGVGAQFARPESRLATILAADEHQARPDFRTWDAMWSRIDTAASGVQPMRSSRLVRLWRPLAAVAAGLLFLAAWQVAQPPAEDGWPLRLATDTEIQSLEVYGDATPFVVSAGQNGNAIKVIWMLAEQS